MDRSNFVEANVNDLVLLIILPIISDFRCRTGCGAKLFREKQVVSGGSYGKLGISITEKICLNC